MVISKIAKSGEPAQSERGYHKSPALIGDGVSYLGHGLQVGSFYPEILYACSLPSLREVICRSVNLQIIARCA